MEKMFAIAENRWKEAFQSCMSELELQHSTTMRLQAKVEEERGEECDRLMHDIRLKFDEDEAGREMLFEDAHSAQQSVYRRQEKLRNKMFKKTLAIYREESERQLDMQHKDSEWYARNRELIAERRRYAMDLACERLRQQISDQMNSLLRYQEEQFAAAERRRDDVVKETVGRKVLNIYIYNLD
jgi:hypothetical protein